jgi:hypothetical protein
MSIPVWSKTDSFIVLGHGVNTSLVKNRFIYCPLTWCQYQFGQKQINVLSLDMVSIPVWSKTDSFIVLGHGVNTSLVKNRLIYCPWTWCQYQFGQKQINL